VLPIAGAVTALLVAFASGYGPHRDELYFVAAGRHLDWAYADQGPVTPLIARAMSELSSSLTVLRVPSALMAGAIVLLTGLIARELGGSRRAELIASACAASGVIVLFTGHLLSTSTVDLLVWAALTWLVVRSVRTDDERLWLVAGVVLGIGLLNKPLPAFLAFGLLAGVAIAGPRRLLRSGWVWGGAAIALALWSPWLVWQADHGWPQLDVADSIRGGGSTSSEPWWSIVPFQLLLVSPLLSLVWIAGLVRLWRDERFRFLVWCWVVLAVVFMATGGKPYYLAGLLPVLLGAGAVTTDRWLEAGGWRPWALGGAIASSAVVAVLIALPVLPAGDADPVLAVNDDVGETIGWPAFVRTVASVHRSAPSAVILTTNYGEAGAIDRYGPEHGLPRAYSGHNAYHDWGPPPDGAAPVVVVGRGPLASLRGCRVVARVDTGIDNEEDGAPVSLCDGPRRPWSQEWPALRRLG
jgi:hypothetical protein